jgi:hypothetical protein
MQTAEALERVARECVEDLADDGVVYAEVRFAPELHTEAGLRLEAVAEAVLAGFATGMATPAAAGRPIVVRGCSRPCAPPPARSRSPNWPSATATPGWPASTWPGPRWATRRPCTWRRSPWSSGRASMPPCMPGRPSGCRRSGRRCSGAGPSGWATGCASWTTSPCGRRRPVTLGRLASYVRDCRVPSSCARLQRPHRRCRQSGRAPDQDVPPARLPGHHQHRQPAHERGEPVVGDGPRAPRSSAGTGPTCAGCRSTP